MEKEALERIEVLQGHITRLQLDAVINAANTSLLGGGGVYGYPVKEAGKISVDNTRDFLKDNRIIKRSSLFFFLKRTMFSTRNI